MLQVIPLLGKEGLGVVVLRADMGTHHPLPPPRPRTGVLQVIPLLGKEGLGVVVLRANTATHHPLPPPPPRRGVRNADQCETGG